jgi:1-acyl-sn-glycerol-3-phosphate acyltransferase
MLANLCSFVLRFFGWRVDNIPKDTSCVFIVAPHTSNWDFIIGLLVMGKQRLNLHFMIKEEAMFFGLKKIFYALGAIPVDRSQQQNLVYQVKKRFDETPLFQLIITPEGTRSPVKKYKTGFFYIAQAANKPIIPIGLDFKHKYVCLGPPIIPHSLQQTLEEAYNFFEKIEGKHPQKQPKPHQDEEGMKE